MVVQLGVLRKVHSADDIRGFSGYSQTGLLSRSDSRVSVVQVSSGNTESIMPSIPLISPISDNAPNSMPLSERSNFLDRHKTKLTTLTLAAVTGISIFAFYYFRSVLLEGAFHESCPADSGDSENITSIAASRTTNYERVEISEELAGQTSEQIRGRKETDVITLVRADEFIAAHKNWLKETFSDLDETFRKKGEEFKKQSAKEREELNVQFDENIKKINEQSEKEEEELNAQFDENIKKINAHSEKEREELSVQFDENIKKINAQFERNIEEINRQSEKEELERNARFEKNFEEINKQSEKEKEERYRELEKEKAEIEAYYRQQRAQELKAMEAREAFFKKREGNTWREGIDFLQRNVLELTRSECKIPASYYQHLSDLEFVTHPDLDPTCWFHARAFLGRGEEGGFNRNTFIEEGCSYAEHLYRQASLSLHPDKAGSAEAMHRLISAKKKICEFANLPPLQGKESIKKEDLPQEALLLE